MSREEAELIHALTIEDLIDHERFPRVASAFASLEAAPASDSRADFAFGQALILDGVERMAPTMEAPRAVA